MLGWVGMGCLTLGFEAWDVGRHGVEMTGAGLSLSGAMIGDEESVCCDDGDGEM